MQSLLARLCCAAAQAQDGRLQQTWHSALPQIVAHHLCAVQLCLELVLAIALRNRDRAALLWPLVHDYLALIMGAEGSKPGNALVTRAALGLLRCALFI